VGSPPVEQHPEQLSEPLVWIVVLHYQGPDHTRACLQSLRALKYGNFNVLLIDNGSPDRSGDALAAEFPEFSYKRMTDNLGFAGGCNAGAQESIGRGAEWVWFLNNDAWVEPDTLSVLMSSAGKHAEAAALGAVVYTPSGDGYVPNGGGEIDFRRGKTYERKRAEPGADTLPCEWLSGCNLLVNSQKFQSVRGFDEQYFLYFEDTDLCLRLRRAGWQCLLVPAARVEHAGGASTEGDRQTWRRYYYTRNRLLFFGSHLSKAQAVLPLLSIGMHLFRHVLVLPWRGAKGRRQLRAELLGLSDYVGGRFGKAECLDW